MYSTFSSWTWWTFTVVILLLNCRSVQRNEAPHQREDVEWMTSQQYSNREHLSTYSGPFQRHSPVQAFIISFCVPAFSSREVHRAVCVGRGIVGSTSWHHHWEEPGYPHKPSGTSHHRCRSQSWVNRHPACHRLGRSTPHYPGHPGMVAVQNYQHHHNFLPTLLMIFPCYLNM